MLNLFFGFILLILILLGYLDYYRKANYWSKYGIKGPRPLPLLGNIISILKGTVDNKWQKLYGNTFGVFEFDRPVLTVCDPQAIENVLIKECHSFVRLNMNLPENFSKQVLFQTSDSRWRQLRKIKAQVFTTKRLKFYYNIVDRCAQRFADHIEDMANGKQYIHLKDLYSKFTMDVSLKCSFSVQTSIYDNDQQTVQLWSSAHRLIHKLKCNELIARAPSYMQSMAKLFGFGYDKQFVDLENRLIDYIVARLQQSSSSNHNNDCDNDFVGVYLESGVLDKKDNKAICYYLLDLFFPLFGTVSESLSVLHMHLAKHPGVQQKLYEEIVSALKETPDGQLSYETLTHLPYMEAVIKESMRLNPTAVRLRRIYMTDTGNSRHIIPGIQLKIGDRIDVSCSAVHMSADNYDDPFVFNADRFVSENQSANFDVTKFLNFSIGPQSCLANRFTSILIKTLLVHMITRYRFVVTNVDDLNKPKICESLDLPFNIQQWRGCFDYRKR